MLASKTSKTYRLGLSTLKRLQCLCEGPSREFADVPSISRSDLTSPSLINKGIKRGPGGRASVSGICATIFGASGFLGRYIVQALARQGTQCVLPHRCDELDVQHLKPMGDLGQIVLLRDFDIFDDEQLKRAVSRSNLVINCIGQDIETMNFKFEDVHVEIARRIATAAAASGSLESYLHVSSLAASPDHPSRRLRTKAEGERLTKEIFPNAVIFKAAHMIGVEDRVFNNYAKLAKNFPLVPLIDGGLTRLQPTYVRDVADAVVGSLNHKESRGNTYYLGGPEILTVKEIVHLTFDVIREKCYTVPVPARIAKLLGQPREFLLNYAQLPMNPIFTPDYADEMQIDSVVPEGVLTYKELDISPKKVTAGIPIEHVRYYRVGGYDQGAASQDARARF